jgi:hypothetical protein
MSNSIKSNTFGTSKRGDEQRYSKSFSARKRSPGVRGEFLLRHLKTLIQKDEYYTGKNRRLKRGCKN